MYGALERKAKAQPLHPMTSGYSVWRTDDCRNSRRGPYIRFHRRDA